MKVLAFDTALNACSVAIMDGPRILGHIHEKRRRGHAETLMPMIEALMHKTGLEYKDLDLISVTVGPGTFTGLRIGLAAARGLALAANKPLRGITTLEALAAAVPPPVIEGRPIFATADARRGEIYVQAFKRLKNDGLVVPLSPATAIKTEEAFAAIDLEPAVIVGSGGPLLEKLPGFDAEKFQLLDLDEDPDASHVARLALHRGIPEPDAPPPAPLYLRAPDAKLPGGLDPIFK